MSNSGVNFDDDSVIFYLILEKEGGYQSVGYFHRVPMWAGALLTLGGTLYVESPSVGLCVKLSHEAIPGISNFFCFVFFKD